MTKRAECSELAAIVRDARQATQAFVAGLNDDQLMGPKLDIVNPLLWEIGHVAWFQEYFILRRLDGAASLRPEADSLYDSMRVAHDTRWDLPLPTLAWTEDYARDVQEAILARLAGPLASETDSYFYRLVTSHEDMHTEAFCYSRQTLALPKVRFSPVLSPTPPARGPWPGDVTIPGMVFALGAATDADFVFDNEKWAHECEVAPFTIARAPVTNRDYTAFVDAGGYKTRAWWSPEGWAWLQSSGVARPAYWQGEPGAWRVRQFDAVVDLPPDQPMMFVNWHEANAYCAYAKRRLPTELEWEVAATAEPGVGGRRAGTTKRVLPWSLDGNVSTIGLHANLDGVFGGPVDVSACGAGDSAFGCRQMLGNVWEWTASDFLPYPGFSADAYREYSEPWFGTRKVLRGGCWATRARLASPVYRNFFPPDRRDIFAGFRTCAVDLRG